jgi:hypothetical protein
MNETFDARLRRTVLGLLEVLRREPRAYHEIGGDASDFYESVVVGFDSDTTVELKCSGIGPYDYTAMCRPKYKYPTTAEQIRELVVSHGHRPLFVRFRFVDRRDTAPDNQPVVEIDFSHVELVIATAPSSPIDELPYRIAGVFRDSTITDNSE